jgi:uncharacterized membrane protein (UPF0136 family)
MVLSVYIVLLVVGGLIGLIKAGSKVSLVTSLVSAAALGYCTQRRLIYPAAGVVLALVAVFTIRYNKSRKFMPAGMLVVLSSATLVALCLLK